MKHWQLYSTVLLVANIGSAVGMFSPSPPPTPILLPRLENSTSFQSIVSDSNVVFTESLPTFPFSDPPTTVCCCQSIINCLRKARIFLKQKLAELIS